ncbi:hypothetical protein ACLIBH_07400 [Virgibacillus sp. W0430]|uniref:hypothetical protein n=1 Tax=Virgibacillus sp. W0430 TaxID=3391580 RepID=UPI003F44DB33
MSKIVLVLEVSNATDEQIQTGLGKAFNNFCNEYKGAGITASVIKPESATKVLDFINEEEK